MRLDNPHPDSFLYFAARLREDEELCHVSPELLISQHRFTRRGAGIVMRTAQDNLQLRAEVFTASYRQAAQERDAAVDMSNPAVRFLAETCGSYASLLQAWAAPAPKTRQGPNGWRPRWQTVDGIVLGAWFAAARSCTRAAELLNTKRPHRLEGVDRGAVRRSIDRETARFARNSPLGHEITFWSAMALVRISEMRSALAVWQKLHASKGRNTVGAYWRGLRLDGRLFEMKAAAEEAELSASTGLRQEAEAAAWVIHGRALEHLMKVAAERHVSDPGHKSAAAMNAAQQ